MIEIVVEDITEIKADCVVNAANKNLAMGSGVCGDIFHAAGPRKLTEACQAIGRIHTGEAVITPSFEMSNTKHIIHTAGPIYRDGHHNEAEKLAACYRNSLQLALENQCRSIAFPLISSGIYGYPKEEAWEIAIRTCQKFMDHHDGIRNVYFTVLNQNAKIVGENVLNQMKVH